MNGTVKKKKMLKSRDSLTVLYPQAVVLDLKQCVSLQQQQKISTREAGGMSWVKAKGKAAHASTQQWL